MHDLDLEEQPWVEALHAAAREVLDEGLGTFVYSYRVAGSTIRLGAVAGVETAPAFGAALFAWGAENERALARIYRTGLGSLEQAARLAGVQGVALTAARPWFEPHAVADVLTLAGHHAGGYGVFVTAPRARGVPAKVQSQSRPFERLAVELGGVARLRQRREGARLAKLSDGELRVARLLVEGASDKLIAAELGVALSTVSTFARRVRAKLGCRPGEETLLLRSRVRSTGLQQRLALLDRLTNSECDVVTELLVGASYADIAEQRGVSPRTVASQSASIFRKCGVAGRRELAAALLAP
jgi:DNA-binding NarL/FixJ family response regulator